MKGENSDRRFPGAATDVAAPFAGVRIMDVLLRRIDAVKAEAEEAWEVWKANREDLKALHCYVRRVKRAARLKEAAMMDLEMRAQRFMAAMEGRPA
jgi:hypothetical protein